MPTCTSSSRRARPGRKKPTHPAKISAAKAALAAKVQAARAGARQGDIFTPAVRPVFRRLLAPELKGEDGRDAKAVLKDDAPAPGTVPFKVNAKYPENQPLPVRAGEPAADAAAASRAAANIASSASICCCSTRRPIWSSTTS